MTTAAADDFSPTWWLRNAHLQSVLASSALRRLWHHRRTQRLERDAKPVTLDCGEGVRLTGCHTAQDVAATPRGLAVLFHGWEGSVRSTYLLGTGARLLAEGWDVFRLNFRDHGGNHALNPGLFHACRIDEVVGAVRAIQQRYRPRPLVLAGFSMGGNFALRVAVRARAATLELAGAVAVCPVIDAHHGLFQLEHAPRMYHDYFMWQWCSSLKAKQRAFPDIKMFEPSELHGNLRSLTQALVLRHTELGGIDNYLDGYSVTGDRLGNLDVPTSILASEDDPVCPASDLAALTLPPCVEVNITPRGGHCGFIRDWHLDSFAEDYIAERLARLAPTAQTAADPVAGMQAAS